MMVRTMENKLTDFYTAVIIELKEKVKNRFHFKFFQ